MAQDEMLALRDEANHRADEANETLPSHLKLRHAGDIVKLGTRTREYFTLFNDATGLPTDRIYTRTNLDAVIANTFSLAQE